MSACHIPLKYALRLQRERALCRSNDWLRDAARCFLIVSTVHKLESAPNLGGTWTTSNVPPPRQDVVSVPPPGSVPSITCSSLGSRKYRLHIAFGEHPSTTHLVCDRGSRSAATEYVNHWFARIGRNVNDPL